MAKALARGDVAGASLSAPDRALLAYADKLTRDAAAVGDTDLEQLRTLGFDDAQLWEATFVVAFFNFVTRMADAFGITPLPEWEAAVGLGRTDDPDSGH